MRTAGESVGRVVAVGIPGPTLDAETRRTLERLRPGAVVLFRRNVVEPAQLRALTAALHRLPARPLVAIDHEGGGVTRLGPPFTAFPSAAEVGRAGPEAARAVGGAIGRELACVGIDVDLAPVLDVAVEADSVIGDRAYAADPARVAAAAVAFAQGLATAGVLPCGKHFPGHGATRADSHRERPVLQRERTALEAVELVPFRAAVAAGIPMLMTAHALYPALDAGRIATFSPRIADQLLRHELGFEGVLWSDSLGMGAVASECAPPEAAVRALRAGVDGVLVCDRPDDAAATVEALRAALSDGRLAPARLRQAAERIAGLPRRRRRRALALPNEAHHRLADRVRAVAASGRAC